MAISYADFEKVDFRSGTVVKVDPSAQTAKRVLNTTEKSCAAQKEE